MVFAVGFAMSALIPRDAVVSTTAWIIAFSIGFASTPISITIAITRFRLYDIDRIVSRTVTYALVIGLLLAVYTGATVLSTEILPVDSDLTVAAATLAAAALFTPLRRAIQRRIDRRFNRSRYIAQQEMDSFTGKLRDTTDLAVLHADLGGVIERTLQPTSIGLWIRGPA